MTEDDAEKGTASLPGASHEPHEEAAVLTWSQDAARRAALQEWSTPLTPGLRPGGESKPRPSAPLAQQIVTRTARAVRETRTAAQLEDEISAHLMGRSATEAKREISALDSGFWALPSATVLEDVH